MEAPNGSNFFHFLPFLTLMPKSLHLLLPFSWHLWHFCQFNCRLKNSKALCAHVFCDASPTKWETVLISSSAHFGTTQFPPVSQQSWVLGTWCFARLISNKHKAIVAYEKVNSYTNWASWEIPLIITWLQSSNNSWGGSGSSPFFFFFLVALRLVLSNVVNSYNKSLDVMFLASYIIKNICCCIFPQRQKRFVFFIIKCDYALCLYLYSIFRYSIGHCS